MKKILIAAVVPFVLLSTSAFADTQDCATRVNAINSQIEIAKQYGNTHKIASLQIALAKVQANCTDAGQVSRAASKVQDKQNDVRKAQDEVRDAEKNLREAQVRNDAKKIQKAQEKLVEKQDKLRDKMDDLSSAQADLAALKG
jgi:chromosome segregation ATPase